MILFNMFKTIPFKDSSYHIKQLQYQNMFADKVRQKGSELCPFFRNSYISLFPETKEVISYWVYSYQSYWVYSYQSYWVYSYQSFWVYSYQSVKGLVRYALIRAYQQVEHKFHLCANVCQYLLKGERTL